MQLTNKKILIVDGNDPFRTSLGTFLKGLGHEVFEGATGQEAIDKAAEIQPHLILMDVSLPGINGDEVTVRLKSKRARLAHRSALETWNQAPFGGQLDFRWPITRSYLTDIAAASGAGV